MLDQPVGDTERRRAAYDDVEVELRRRLHQTIRRVSQDIDSLKFNTMIAALMEFTNFLVEVGDDDLRARPIWTETIETFLVLLAPSAVFMAEELWERTGHGESIHLQPWPECDAPLESADETGSTLVVQTERQGARPHRGADTLDADGACSSWYWPANFCPART